MATPFNQEFLASALVFEIGCPYSVFSGFPQSLQENFMIFLAIRP
jgi:hypothetical protein